MRAAVPLEQTLWSKSFILLLAGNFFMFMSFQMLLPTLPPYLQSLGASGLEVGLITTLFSIGAILSRPYVGFMLQYRMRKPMVLIGVFALLLVMSLYAVTQVVLLLLLLRLIHGLAWGWSSTAIATAATDIVPTSRLGEGMGYFMLTASLGLMLAPSIGIYLFQTTTFASVISFAALFGVGGLVLTVLVKYKVPDFLKTVKKENLKFSYIDSCIEKASILPGMLTITASMGYGSVITFVVIFSEERGIPNVFLFYICNAVAAVVSRSLVGKWFDKNGPYGIVFVSSVLAMAGFWILSFAHSTAGIALAGICFGLGFSSLISTLQAWMLLLAPKHRRGVANGMHFSALDLGIGIGGLVMGFIALFVPISAMFQISSLAYAVILVLTAVQKRKQSLRQTQGTSISE